MAGAARASDETRQTAGRGVGRSRRSERRAGRLGESVATGPPERFAEMTVFLQVSFSKHNICWAEVVPVFCVVSETKMEDKRGFSQQRSRSSEGQGRTLPGRAHVLAPVIGGKFSHTGFAKRVVNLPRSGNKNKADPQSLWW